MGVRTKQTAFADRVPAGPLSILSVCRRTEKKGIALGLRALSELDALEALLASVTAPRAAPPAPAPCAPAPIPRTEGTPR